MTNAQKETCKNIFCEYGLQNQTIKAVEELAELQQAICKANSEVWNHNRFPNTDNLTEEIADSLIMIEQMKFAYKISDNDVNEIIEMKLQRQQERIKDEL